ncbi:MAG: CRISPR-associated endonuclease Cas2 [Desulfovibrio sp.]|nr:CRISPR-associated endonuclease Cas2 [Desulfovibrio sp.]
MDNYLMDDTYLVLYDIADSKRLARAAAIVLDYGIRVQKSVYEVHCNRHTLAVLQQRLAQVIEPEADGVKIVPLCASCQARKMSVGAPLPDMAEAAPWVVI